MKSIIFLFKAAARSELSHLLLHILREENHAVLSGILFILYIILVYVILLLTQLD